MVRARGVMCLDLKKAKVTPRPVDPMGHYVSKTQIIFGSPVKCALNYTYDVCQIFFFEVKRVCDKKK